MPVLALLYCRFLWVSSDPDLSIFSCYIGFFNLDFILALDISSSSSRATIYHMKRDIQDRYTAEMEKKWDAIFG